MYSEVDAKFPQTISSSKNFVKMLSVRVLLEELPEKVWQCAILMMQRTFYQKNLCSGYGFHSEANPN